MIIVMTASQHFMSTFEDKVSASQIHTWLEIKLDTPKVVDTWLIYQHVPALESLIGLILVFVLILDFDSIIYDSDIHVHVPQLQGKYLFNLQHSF